MRRFIGPALGAAFLLASAGTTLGQGVVGTPHDLSDDFATPGNQVCVVCHTPHTAQYFIAEAPLWNHDTTTTSFTMYSSSSVQGTIDAQPTGNSKACLSCHDATVALDAFGGNAGTPALVVPDSANVGASAANPTGNDDLSDDHPVSVTYVGPATDPGLKDASTFTNVVLFANKVQCASCHNPHDYSLGPSQPFLRTTNDASALCQECHAK